MYFLGSTYCVKTVKNLTKFSVQFERTWTKLDINIMQLLMCNFSVFD